MNTFNVNGMGRRLSILPAVVLLLGMVAPEIGVASEKNIGKHTKDEVRKACNAAGGELLGVSDLGSYGCEVASKGTMILCNKNEQCTAYRSARSAADQKRVLTTLHLKVKKITP